MDERHTADDRDARWKRLLEELENFEEIARHLRPSPGELPQLPGIEICGLSMPLTAGIGGDHLIYIDFNRRYDLDRRVAEARSNDRPEVVARLAALRDRAGILVADVSGHRMTDALIGSMLHQAFLLGVHYELDMFGEVTTRLFEQINTRFYRTTAVNKYFTMIYGEISSEGTLRFLSAAHQPPAVFSREFGRFMQISSDRLVSFPPVGTLPSSADVDDRDHTSLLGYKKSYEVNEINLLATGDILLLHTDGLSDHAGGEYFPRRLETLLREMRGESAAEICDRIREDVLASAAPEDDITAVVIRKTA